MWDSMINEEGTLDLHRHEAMLLRCRVKSNESNVSLLMVAGTLYVGLSSMKAIMALIFGFFNLSLHQYFFSMWALRFLDPSLKGFSQPPVGPWLQSSRGPDFCALKLVTEFRPWLAA